MEYQMRIAWAFASLQKQMQLGSTMVASKTR
jgi:hypothetical protein